MEKNKTAPHSDPGRRVFLRRLIYGALSTSLPKILCSGAEKQGSRFKKGEMFYRRLGRTKLFISEISLGGSPLPERSVLFQAIERGVNYIDASCTYMNGNSERQIGRLFKEMGRDRIHVGTKFHLRGKNWDEQSIIHSVEASLKRLQTDYVDVLLIHGADRKENLTDERVLEAFERLKKQGKYRFQGLSCHTNHHQVVKEALDCGYYDMIQLGYNVFDIQNGKEERKIYDDYLGQSGIRRLLSLAASKDIGIIAMKTLKVGGKSQNLDKYKTGQTSIYQAMLKWALENKNIASVVTEMLTFDQLEEDLGAVGKILSPDERKNLLLYVAENSRDYCHMCGLCQDACPSRIKTTSILRYLMYHETYKKTDTAAKGYSQLHPSQTAVFCRNCGECEISCPYGVSIRRRIREAHRILG